MIIRDSHDVSCIEFSDAVDSFGQRRKEISSTTTIQMAIYPFNNSELVDDIRFREVTDIGLTKAIVNDTNEIIDGDKQYLVTYTIPSKRYNQVFLRLKK